MLGLIWAQARGAVIGAHGTMPWHLPEDLAHFRRTTDGAAVLMGRRTWESLPERFRPLPGRRNVVLTRDAGYRADGAETSAELGRALELAGPGPVWVIGGGQVYAETLALADRLVVTEIDIEVDGDTLAPDIDPAAWEPVSSDPGSGWHTSADGVRHRFTTWERRGTSDA